MPSTFTSSLRLEKIATGEQNGTWGATTNRNLEIVLEKAIAGLANIVVPDADYTLSVVNGGDDEARCATLVVSGTLTAERRIYVPGVAKQYAVRNATTGGFGVQVRTATGSPVTVPAGRTLYLFCDGIDCFNVKPLFLSADIISALGYVPYDAANPSGFITICVIGTVCASAVSRICWNSYGSNRIRRDQQQSNRHNCTCAGSSAVPPAVLAGTASICM